MNLSERAAWIRLRDWNDCSELHELAAVVADVIDRMVSAPAAASDGAAAAALREVAAALGCLPDPDMPAAERLRLHGTEPPDSLPNLLGAIKHLRDRATSAEARLAAVSAAAQRTHDAQEKRIRELEAKCSPT